jgi:hypothetical protein
MVATKYVLLYLLACLGPSVEPSGEFYDRETASGEDFCRLFAAASAAAIKGYGTIFVESFECVYFEVIAKHIDVLASSDVTLGILFEGAHVKALHGGVGYQVGKFFNADGLESFVGSA